MAEIVLTKGYVAQVDADLAEWLGQWTWYALPVSGGPHIYARRDAVFAGRRTEFYMHRVIAGAPDGALVDHRSGDTLDNRRANLRIASSQQNSANSLRRVGKTGFRGVRPPKGGHRYSAEIGAGGVKRVVGWADTAEEAARIYDEAARRLHGDFAVLNFPQEAP